MGNYSTLSSVTNAEDWSQPVRVTDGDEGFDLSGYTIQIRVSDDRGCQVLAGSTSDGVVSLVNDDEAVPSIISWVFRASTMATIRAGNYIVGVRITDGTNTNQIILGKVAIVDGGFA